MTNPLDNPVWSSLVGHHAGLARRHANVARYPAHVAPFAAVDPVAANAADVSEQLAKLVGVGEGVLFVGCAPTLDTRVWKVEQLERIGQFTCPGRLSLRDGPPILPLSEANVPDVLELTGRVYPHYFRPRSTTMGRYFGIYDGNKLAAITGERMGFEGHVELSAICTDPGYTGRGYAQRLVAMLANDILDQGALPFLHVSHRNARAKALYQHMGFRQRADIGLLAATRVE